MRIAYIARRPIPSKYANSVQIMRMCEAFAGNGHEVTLYALPGEGPAEGLHDRYNVADTFAIERQPRTRGPLYKPRFFPLLALRVDRHTDLFYGRDIAGLALVSLLGKPVVYEAHLVPPPGSLNRRLLNWLFGRRNFAHLVCITSTLEALHREAFRSLGDKHIIVAPMAAAELPPVERGADLPGGKDSLHVGFVGRPYPGKGIEAMVAAAAALPKLSFHVVGASREELDWVPSELPANLHFHGYRPPAELPPFYKSFDIAVAPYGAKVMNASKVESAATTSPLKMPEYMAARLPVIVSDLPGVRDIADEEVALIVPPGDDAAFIAALERLSGDADLRERLAVAGYQRYRERHTTSAMARAVLGDLAQ